MELVFSPTLKNGLEAASLVKELILILSRLGTCTCELEEGTFRVDANISVNWVGEPLGVKTEVKNINSVRFISRAIDYEINRQIGVLEDGGFVANETRAYDYDEKKTVYMRDKGTFQDYRFMPEPNLPPIKICDDSEFVCTTEDESSVININELKKKLPVLPDAERCNLRKKYNLPLDAIDKLVSNEGAQEMFEICASDYSESDLMTICDFLFSNVQHQFNLRNLSFKDCPVSGSQIAEILELLISRTISEGTANDILDMLFNGDQRPAREIVNEYNWFLIRDPEELKSLCLLVMATHKKVAQKYRKSKKKRHMAVLIAALNESVNNRASYKEVAAMFHNLICKEEKEMDVHKIQEDNKE
ncbi:glutamyl-tRNA(Gln) amidotransferase subunit B, mitochondrial-like [Stegodyphus dumicola]|uniref:glutamyl-tRNA(Gln) amidotransferase subunit B, mitochondrial-like n=1 Tax=Stegodyphus dumicola TaxID=202533 RepID=UPI0015B28516|nr:glutamyl-tRNA(Gln) amidotransferase subunit B, mitochondrial-like [Stegodyphus dumicola]